MKLAQEFTLQRPVAETWAFFHDIPSVAACLPGATYEGQREDGQHTGRISMKVGPFQSAFEGAAEVVYDEPAHRVAMSGKGVDKKGGSRGKMTMDCRLIADDRGTKVVVDADIQLSGAIAQFGRTGIIQEIAAVLIRDFVANVEAAMPAPARKDGTASQAASAAPEPRKAAHRQHIGGFRLLWLSLRGWFRTLANRQS